MLFDLEINDELFSQYLESDDKSDIKFQKISQAIGYLKLPICPEKLTQFKDIILDKWRLRGHDSIIRFLKSAQHVANKLSEIAFKGIDIKTLTNGYHKLKLVRQIEAEFGLNLGEPQAPTKVDMEDSLYKLIRITFRTTMPKPASSQEVVEFKVLQ